MIKHAISHSDAATRCLQTAQPPRRQVCRQCHASWSEAAFMIVCSAQSACYSALPADCAALQCLADPASPCWRLNAVVAVPVEEISSRIRCAVSRWRSANGDKILVGNRLHKQKQLSMSSILLICESSCKDILYQSCWFLKFDQHIYNLQSWQIINKSTQGTLLVAHMKMQRSLKSIVQTKTLHKRAT